MTNLTYLSAEELAPKIEAGEISPVELTEQFLERIEKNDDKIKAYITVTPEKAREQAKKAEEEIKNGNYKGKLHGIPVGIKDTYQTEGVLSTSGSALFDDYVPEESSKAVENIEEAGGVVLGKLNMHSLGPGSAGINPTYGTTRNPWNTDHICGGSSSGSSAALAAGFATVTTGTDMWGSLRVPAAMTGVYGLKPTQGLVSSTANIPTSETLDQTGPQGRTVTDVGILLQEMAGYDPADIKSADVEIPDYTSDLDKGIEGLTIGIPSYYREGLDEDVEKLFDESVEKLKDLGAEIKDIEMPELNLAKFAGLVTATSEAGANYYNSLKTDLDKHAQDVRGFLLAGSILTGTQYIRAQKARRVLVNGYKEAFKEVDVILGPTIPITTPAFDEENWAEQAIDVVEKVLPFTVPANLAGIPAFSVPMGLDSKGLPTGMQFFGKNFSEKQLLQIGKAWETTEPLDYSKIDLKN
jgi:aspartyl-tRNA(Asn)/glutamyl-tRNA(Gln) amidotransferase subunit A